MPLEKVRSRNQQNAKGHLLIPNLVNWAFPVPDKCPLSPPDAGHLCSLSRWMLPCAGGLLIFQNPSQLSAKENNNRTWSLWTEILERLLHSHADVSPAALEFSPAPKTYLMFDFHSKTLAEINHVHTQRTAQNWTKMETANGGVSGAAVRRREPEAEETRQRQHYQPTPTSPVPA
ncbi:Centromere Protein I [Manis pentadactyla]|nr:Centromere Protein I [Manis pentadactyla]